MYSDDTFNDGFYESLEREPDRCKICNEWLHVCQFNTRSMNENLHVGYIIESRDGRYQCTMFVKSPKNGVLFFKRSDIERERTFAMSNVISKIGLRATGKCLFHKCNFTEYTDKEGLMIAAWK